MADLMNMAEDVGRAMGTLVTTVTSDDEPSDEDRGYQLQPQNGAVLTNPNASLYR